MSKLSNSPVYSHTEMCTVESDLADRADDFPFSLNVWPSGDSRWFERGNLYKPERGR